MQKVLIMIVINIIITLIFNLILIIMYKWKNNIENEFMGDLRIIFLVLIENEFL